MDTCVVLDFFESRKPFAKDALSIFRAAAMGQFSGYITAKSATDIYYLMRKYTHSKDEAKGRLYGLLFVVDMLDSKADDVRLAIESDIPDFEDAVMAQTALRSGMDFIVTRNTHDYEKSLVTVYFK